MKAVLTTKVGSGYDDVREQRYHFPATYLNQIKAAEGDLVVYYEPRRTPTSARASDGRQAYFALARIARIESDPQTRDHFYAEVTDYLDFDRDVPFRVGTEYLEGALQRADGGTNRGAFRRSVRLLPSHEFEAIVSYGFSDVAVPNTPSTDAPTGFAEPEAPAIRPITEVTFNRPFRDRAFARQIQWAYDQTCAFTGLKIVNGGGNPETQAAHIQPIALAGPDSVRNGIALSSTMHWMFDRGLISIDDDYGMLLARKSIPDAIGRLINPDRTIHLPRDESQRPHPHFLRYHRDHVFKG